MTRVPTVQEIDEVLTDFCSRTGRKSMNELVEEMGALYGALASSSEMRALLAGLVIACRGKKPVEWVRDHALDLIGMGIEIGLRMASDDMIPPGKVN